MSNPHNEGLPESFSILMLLWIVPIALLVVAIAPLPYGYYTFLRLIVCGCCCAILYGAHIDGRERWTLMSFGIVGLAVLYNPLVPVHLTKGIWFWLNLGSAAFLVAHLWWTAKPRKAT